MKTLTIRFLILHTLVFLVAGVGGFWTISTYIPSKLSEAYALIPSYYLIAGSVFIILLAKKVDQDDKKIVNFYLLLRVTKILIALAILLIYAIVNRADAKNFALTFGLFYMIYLVVETYIFTVTEKWLKQKKNTNTEEPTLDEKENR